MSAGRSNVDLRSSKLMGPCFDDLREGRVEVVQETCSSTNEDLPKEHEQSWVGEGQAERFSLSFLSAAFPDSEKGHLSYVRPRDKTIYD